MDVLDRQLRRQRLNILDKRVTLYIELKSKRGLTDDDHSVLQLFFSIVFLTLSWYLLKKYF